MRVIQFLLTKDFDKPVMLSDLKNLLSLYDEIYIGEPNTYSVSIDEPRIEIMSGSASKSFELYFREHFGYIVFSDSSILVPLVLRTLWNYTNNVMLFEGEFDPDSGLKVNDMFREKIVSLNAIYANINEFEYNKLFELKHMLISEKIPLSNGTYFGYFIRGADSVLDSSVVEEILVSKDSVVKINDVYELANQGRKKVRWVIEYAGPIIEYYE